MAGHFYWLPDIVNFTLLGAEYFYIPINTFELCCGLRLSHLETVSSSRGMLLRSVVGPEPHLVQGQTL